METAALTNIRASRPLFLALLGAFAVMLMSASTSQAAPPAGCTVLQGQVVCVLDVVASAGSNVEIKGTNLDAGVDVELVFDDGTSAVYHKNGIGNPAGSTVQWPVATTITRAVLDAYTGPIGFKRQAERELGMAAGQATGTGQAIKIQDNAIGGKTVISVKLYDVTRSRATTSLSVTTNNGTNGTWVPPTITVAAPEPNLVVITAPSGLLTIDRFEAACTSQINPGSCTLLDGTASITTIRANRVSGTNIGIVPGSINWSDTRVEFRSEYLPGKEIKVLSAKKGTASGDYDLVPDLYFTPKVNTAFGTGAIVAGVNVGEYKIQGGDFRLLRYMIATLDNGTTRLVGITGTTGDSGTSIQTLGLNTLTVRDTGAVGHTITQLDFYYRDGNAQETLVTSYTTPFHVKGNLTSVTTSAAATATLNGVGLQAVVNVVFTFSNGTTATFNTGEFDSQSFAQLTITDVQLSGMTITGVTATTADGQTFSLSGLNVFIAKLGPQFTLTGPSGGQETATSVSWLLNTADSVTSITCAVDGGAPAACDNGLMSAAVLSGLSLGSHSVVITAANSNGPTSAPARTFTVVAPPSIAIGGVAEGGRIVDPTGVSLSVVNSGGTVTTQECRLDGAVVACSASISISGLANAAHTLSVDSIGPGGVDSVARMFVTGPVADAVIAAGSFTQTGLSLSATFTTSSADSVTCVVFDSSSVPVQSINGCTSPVAITVPSAGDYSLSVTATNATSSTTRTASFTAVAAPTVTITGPGVGAEFLQGDTITGVYATTGSVSSVDCTLDTLPLSSCVSPIDLGTNLPVGNHTLSVTAHGPGGDGSSSTTFKVNAVSTTDLGLAGVTDLTNFDTIFDYQMMAIDRNGRTVVWGNYGNLFKFRAYKNDGTLDTSWGNNGQLDIVNDYGYVQDMEFDANNKLVFVYQNNASSLMYIARLNVTGQFKELDTVIESSSSGYLIARNLEVLSDGNYAVAIMTNQGSQDLRVRKVSSANGSTLGVFTHDVGGRGQADSSLDLVEQADGSMLLSFNTYAFNTNDTGYVVKINPNLTLDTTYGGASAPYAHLPGVGQNDLGRANMVLDNTGGVIVRLRMQAYVGAPSTQWAVALNANGTLRVGFDSQAPAVDASTSYSLNTSSNGRFRDQMVNMGDGTYIEMMRRTVSTTDNSGTGCEIFGDIYQFSQAQCNSYAMYGAVWRTGITVTTYTNNMIAVRRSMADGSIVAQTNLETDLNMTNPMTNLLQNVLEAELKPNGQIALLGYSYTGVQQLLRLVSLN